MKTLFLDEAEKPVKYTGVDFGDPGFSENKEAPLHRWVNWVAGFSGKLVERCIERYLDKAVNYDTLILDPFAGVGTTLVEGLRHGASVIGFELNQYAAMVANAKLGCTSTNIDDLKKWIDNYLDFMASPPYHNPKSQPPKGFRSRIPFFSESVEKKVLLTLDYIDQIPSDVSTFFRIALGSVMVSFSNYTYEPSLCSRPGAGKSLVEDADVAATIEAKLREILEDITFLQKEGNLSPYQKAKVYGRSFFSEQSFVKPGSVDLVITSPPYMNNYHYVRNTRPQLFWLNYVTSSKALKSLEEHNFGKYWQTVRDQSPVSLTVDLDFASNILSVLRSTNEEKGPYGGPGWANYVASYLNDINRFCCLLSRMLARSGVAVIIIGNSIIQGIEIEVDVLYSKIAEQHGLQTEGIYIIRGQRVGSSIVNTGSRQSARKKLPLYDAAVVLRR